MIRKTTVIVASGDADTQWRRIRKSAELRAELRAEHPAERRVHKLYKIDKVGAKEFREIKGIRPDFVDFENHRIQILVWFER